MGISWLGGGACKVPYGTIRCILVPKGTFWYHKVPLDGGGGEVGEWGMGMGGR